MTAPTRRLAGLLIGASLGAVGWGAVLPFLYADVADARHLGGAVAAVTFTLFAIGTLVASPLAGRLADQRDPRVVATLGRLAMVLAVVGFMIGHGAWSVWAAALGYGAALAIVNPSISVLVLELTPAHRRRDAFAWQFIGQNLGLALGGVVGGHLVDLTTATGSRPAYAFAAAGGLASALIVGLVARGPRREPCPVDEPVDTLGYRQVLRAPGLMPLLAVTVLLTLAFYAQFDSGLPAYAFSVLSVAPPVLGTAVAVNAVLVSVLTAPVLALTRRVEPTRLLATCGGIWVAVWLLMAVPMLHHGFASGLIIAGYGLFSVGETMLAPVLTPLAAALAPEGAAGRTLAAMTGAQTFATAIGPGLSAALLALHLPVGFIAMQLACCLLAMLAAARLGRVRAAATTRDEVALAR